MKLRLLLPILSLAISVGLAFPPAGQAADPVPKSQATDRADQSVIVGFDSGRRGGEVTLHAKPYPNKATRILKTITLDSVDHLRSAELQIFGALRAPNGEFTWDRWKWIWFSLNGHQWVRRVEDVSLHRTRGEVDWAKVKCATVKIPNVHFLKKGVNELVIWTTNPAKYGEAGRKKFLVVAVDDSNRPGQSFSLQGDKWTNEDLNGDRDGSPRGEWMVRFRLTRPSDRQIQAADALGPARLRQAISDKQEFVWGFTDALHRVFPDQPYAGPLGNTWTIDAARNEYESCQLVVIPATVDMKMAEVFVGNFVRMADASAGKATGGKRPVTIGRQNTTVRVVRMARTGGMDWPDPLPLAHPIDVARGQVRAWWLTVHVPQNARPGLYTSKVTITSQSTGGRAGKVTSVPLKLRVRDFSIPTVSRFQTVAPVQPEMTAWKISPVSSSGGTVTPRRVLDRKGNLQLDFAEFDKKVEARLAAGQTSFSIGIPYTGAGVFVPWAFDWRVPVEGQDATRRIYVNPVAREDLDARKPENQQSRKWFEQYITQFYHHLESKNWTKHWWIYAADEPHQAEWKEPLTRYFAIIRKCAPKLRIMMTREPTDYFGPHVDIACIMMNHLRSGTHETARKLGQELWCYSCGHLNNPGLTLRESPVDIRTWFWLQEKWQIRRVMLWHSSVYGHTFLKPGADGRGDGQVFYFRRRADEQDEVIPSIRAEMLRDGVEDRQYFHLLKQKARRAGDRIPTSLRDRAAALSKVPDSIARTQYEMSGDVQRLLARRVQIANVIEAIDAETSADKDK